MRISQFLPIGGNINKMKRNRFNRGNKGNGRRNRGRGNGFGGRMAAYDDFPAGRGQYGRGGRGRGRGVGAWQDSANFGPPAWAPRWRWAEDSPISSDANFGPPPWGRGRWLWDENQANVTESRAWLEARKERLTAWKKHLEERLAQTEADLESLDAKAESGDSVE